MAQDAWACGHALTRVGPCLSLLSDTSGLSSLVPVKPTTDHLGFNTSRYSIVPSATSECDGVANHTQRVKAPRNALCHARVQLFRKGKVWAAWWWEDIIREDGTPGKDRRFVTLGEIPKHEAQRSLEGMLQRLNLGQQRPQSVMTFEQFVRERWIPAKMPLLDVVTLRKKRNEQEPKGESPP